MPVVLDLTTAKSVSGGKEEGLYNFEEVGDTDGSSEKIYSMLSMGKKPTVYIKIPRKVFYNVEDEALDNSGNLDTYVSVNSFDVFRSKGSQDLEIIGYSSVLSFKSIYSGLFDKNLNVRIMLEVKKDIHGRIYSDVTITHPDEMVEVGV